MTRKIIEGKAYDTATAAEIGGWSNSYGRSDFHWCEETLYKTPRGNYFIEGEGGARSKYAVSVGQNAWGGSGGNITPITRAEALRWCEEHGIGANTIQGEFGDMIEEA